MPEWVSFDNYNNGATTFSITGLLVKISITIRSAKCHYAV